MGYIYMIKNQLNNKCYIGQTTKSVAKRWAEHQSAAATGVPYESKLYKAINQHGIDNFSIEILEVLPDENLDMQEKYWIKHLNTVDKGYNITWGGQQGRRTINEEKVIDVYNKYQNKHRVAQDLNISTVSVTNILKKHNIQIRSELDVLRQPVTLYNLQGELLQSFISIKEAAEFIIANTQVSSNSKTIQSNIGIACRKKNGTAYGYRWTYQGEPLEPKYIKYGSKPVIMCEIGSGAELDRFESLNSAARHIIKLYELTAKEKTVASNISNSCKQSNRTAYGFIWIKEE